MPNFPDTNVAGLREQLLEGMRMYKQIAGATCDYGDADIEECGSILDEYLANLTKRAEPSQESIREALKKAVLDLNDLNAKCGHSLIETDQRELLCAVMLIAAGNAGLDTDDDIAEPWREW